MGTRLHCHLHFFVLAVQEEQEMMEDSCSTPSPPSPPIPQHLPFPSPPGPHASLPLLSDPSHNPEGEGWSFGNFPVWAQHGFLLAEGVTNMYNKILQEQYTVLYCIIL